jgi:phosphoribosylamine--glycine ligase
VFGPSAAAARIEGSKAFAKEILEAAGVPAARTLDEPAVPCVVKMDGLTAGKGVWVCRTDEELAAALAETARFDGPVGSKSCSRRGAVRLRAVRRGAVDRAWRRTRPQAHRRRGHGTEHRRDGHVLAGPGIRPAEVEELVDRIHRPVFEQLARRASPFVGVLFAG